MKYRILNEEIVYNGHFLIKKGTVEYDTFEGSSMIADRECFERNDSVAVLVYEKDTNCLLFTNQFRYPTIKEDSGWILELTAGSLEGENDNPEERTKKEIKEEIGYEVNELDLIGSFFVSPGGTSERIFLFYTEVSSTDKKAVGGGLLSENENIDLVKIKTTEIRKMYENNEIRDAKTLIAIQWYLMQNPLVKSN